MKTQIFQKTIKVILSAILLCSNVACASNDVNKNQQQTYNPSHNCSHVSPSKVSKCMK